MCILHGLALCISLHETLEYVRVSTNANDVINYHKVALGGGTNLVPVSSSCNHQMDDVTVQTQSNAADTRKHAHQLNHK